MGVVGSLIGVAVGWWLAGPIGMLVGGFVGSAIEARSSLVKNVGGDDRSRQAQGGFYASLLVLMAAVMKADGKVVHAELDYVKRFLVQTLGADQAQELLVYLRDVLKKEIPVREVCMQIRLNVDYSSRLELIHLLFGIGMADGRLDEQETRLIFHISSFLGISNQDITSIQNTYYNTVDSSYKILEITSDVTNEELKKAYKKMAVKYHPDKVEHLGDEFKKTANEKFQKVNEAYEKIKKERGIK